MKHIFKTAIFSILFFNQFVTAQSPWTREAGKGFAHLGFSGIFYNKVEINGKTVDLNADYTDLTLQVYTEYGITNNLEFQFILPYKSVGYKSNIGNFSQDLSGIGNVSFGMKYKVYDGRWKVSTGLLFSANSISKNNVKQLSSGFNAETFLTYASIGTSAGKWYYFGNIGYGFMTNHYSDYMKVSAELGYNIIEKGHIVLLVDTRNVISEEGAFDGDSNQWPSYQDRQSFSAVGLKFNYDFTKDKFGANIAVLGAFDLDNAPVAPSINLGVYSKF